MELTEAGSSWYSVAVSGRFDPEDPLIRFIAAWISFNALYESMYPNQRERQQITRIAENSEFADCQQQLLSNQNYSRAANYIGSRGVVNLRNNETVGLESVASLSELLLAVYQVRCNLFHGGKRIESNRDRELCAAGFIIVCNLLSFHQTGSYVADFEAYFE